jgi:uncharacterized membrane protein
MLLLVLCGLDYFGILILYRYQTWQKIPDEQKPAIGKVIAPAALFYFRWGAAFTVLSGLILAHLNGYLHDAMTLSIGSGIPKTYSNWYWNVAGNNYGNQCMVCNMAKSKKSLRDC